jgi:beta-lactamase family protein
MESSLANSFQELSNGLAARVGVAVASVSGAPMSLGPWSTGVAWSTIKVPLAVAALRADAASPDQLEAVITRSDNAAAEELWSQLGGAAAQRVQSVMREAGDTASLVESRRVRAEYTPFGQTRWSLSDQARFAAGLSQVPGSSRVLDLMRTLTVDHRWGLAAKGSAAKGGWGPSLSGGYLVRQFAIVSGNVGVALAADVVDGGYQAGVQVINSLADWVVGEALSEY